MRYRKRLRYNRPLEAISFGILLCFLVSSCQPTRCALEPCIGYTPTQRLIEKLHDPFPKLSTAERAQDWGKELFVGKAFAKEMDFYRAITCFKKALFLIPRNHTERRLEIEYDILLAYYTAGKYQEAVETFESGRLNDASDAFPAYNDLLITLYDAYMQTDQPERACCIWTKISQNNECTANNLTLGTAIVEADFPTISQTAECTAASESVDQMLSTYCACHKSVNTARVLNAILPGAGYYYVGQKKSALTSFIINTLFIAAAYQLFDRGYIPAAIIVTSLETGWYFGGINGAGIEANQYNQCLYERVGRETMMQERLFPILMLEYGF